MKPKNTVNFFTMVISLFILSSVSFAYGKADKAAEEWQPEMAVIAVPETLMVEPAIDEDMMAQWKEYATPNENHRILDGLVGRWEYTSKHWMNPESPAEESSGTAEGKWIMEGRFVEQVFQGTWMGQPFTGRQTTGYDNAGKEYVSTWFDNMGTGMMMATGRYEPAAKIIMQSGTFNCPFRGKMSMRWVTKFVDENTYIFEMYGPDEDGNDFKGMEIIYKRKQG
jgi:hypothetical protein